MAIFLDLPFWRTAIRGLGALLCNIIYNLISWIYQLFITVSRLNILSSDGVAPIYQRVTMILTIVMTFYITFEFVKYVIQPDTITDKEKGAGNILKRIIIVVVLIAFVPRLFTLAYRAQNIIIENQVISKVILGKKNVNFATFGNDFSANLLSIFYDVNESACQSGCNEEKEIVNSNLDGLRKGEGLNLTQGIENSVSQSGEKIPTIRFDGILAIGVGVFILYILILYSIDVGIRYFQLLFLQIIAPIAIMGYMLPKKDNIFEKWYKQCFSTYIDLFLRLAIIYFVLMIVQVLGDAMNAGTLFAGMDDVSGSIRTFAYIVLVMGLLAFAQRAPKLLGELFPSMGSKAGIGFSLGTKDRLEPVSKMFKGVGKTVSGTANTAGRVVGGVGGTIAGAIAGRGIGGRFRGAAIGAKEGAKKDNKGLPHRRIERASEAATQRRQREEEVIRNTPDVTASSGFQRLFQEEKSVNQATYHKERWANRASEYERQSKLFDVAGGSLDNINKQVEEFKQIKALTAELKAAEARGESANVIKTIDGKRKRAMQEVRRAIVSNNGIITDDMINNPIEVEYDVLDGNGFKTGIKEKLKIRYDDGDRNFSYSVNQVAKNEFAKIGIAAKEVIGKDANGKNITIGDTRVTINGTEKTVTEWLADPNGEKYYAEFANKFKDAMVEQKTKYENTDEYKRAQAYKSGVGDSGGKK